MIAEQLRDLERGMWEHPTRTDGRWMAHHLHPDFAEFGRSGRRYDRAAILDEPVEPFEAGLTDIDVAFLADDVALLTYRSVFRRGSSVQYANRSSVWIHDDGWRLRFHQGTPCEPWDDPHG